MFYFIVYNLYYVLLYSVTDLNYELVYSVKPKKFSSVSFHFNKIVVQTH